MDGLWVLRLGLSQTASERHVEFNYEDLDEALSALNEVKEGGISSVVINHDDGYALIKCSFVIYARLDFVATEEVEA